MALYDPNKRKQGGKGNQQTASTANPAGIKKPTPAIGQDAIEGEFTRVNDKAIGPVQNVQPTGKPVGGGTAGMAVGTGLAADIISSPRISSQIQQGIESAAGKIGVDINQPNDQRLRGYTPSTIGKSATQALPTASGADALSAYQAEYKKRVGALPTTPTATTTPAAPVTTTPTVTAKPITNEPTTPKTYNFSTGTVSVTDNGVKITQEPGPSVESRLGRTKSVINPDTNNDGKISGEEQFLAQYGGNVDRPTMATPEGQRIGGPKREGEYTGGKLSIDLGEGRGGTIQFADNRALSPKQVKSLASQIAFNQSPRFQESAARNEALYQQREADYQQRLERDAEQARQAQRDAALQQAQFNYANAGSLVGKSIAGRRLANLEDFYAKEEATRQSGIEAQGRAATARQTGEMEARKFAVEQSGKTETERAKRLGEGVKAMADIRQTGETDPGILASAYSTSSGELPTIGQLPAILDSSTFKQFNTITNPDEAGNFLADRGLTPDAITSIVNSKFSPQR